MAKNVDCFDSRQGDQIEVIKDLPIQERISWFGGEPSFLKETREHWFSCPHCRAVLPTGREDFEAIKRGWDHIAVERLAKAYSDYSAEFDPTPRSERDAAHYAERAASLGSIYARRVEWWLSWITERPWEKFTVLIDTGDSDQSVPLSSCAEQLRGLSPEVLQFVFEAVLCGELYLPLYKRLERKTVESFIRLTPAGEPNEFTPNPEYPDFESFKNSAEDDEDEGQDDYNELLGDWVTNRFIRLKMLEVFLEFQIAHELLFESLSTAAEGYRKQFEDRFGLPTGSFLDRTQRPATTLTIGANNFAALRKELTDDFDSLRAGQMEILRRLECTSPSAVSSTAALEPAVEAKLGEVYFKLHEVTRQALVS